MFVNFLSCVKPKLFKCHWYNYYKSWVPIINKLIWYVYLFKIKTEHFFHWLNQLVKSFRIPSECVVFSASLICIGHLQELTFSATSVYFLHFNNYSLSGRSVQVTVSLFLQMESCCARWHWWIFQTHCLPHCYKQQQSPNCPGEFHDCSTALRYPL